MLCPAGANACLLSNLKDYVFLKSIIEKWGIERQQEIYFHWYKQLYYQLPKCLKNCDLVFLELDMKHINGFEFAKILRKKDLSIPIVFQTKNTHYGILSYQVQAMHYLLKPLDQKEIYKILDRVLLHQHSKTFIYQFKKEVHKIPYERKSWIGGHGPGPAGHRHGLPDLLRSAGTHPVNPALQFHLYSH